MKDDTLLRKRTLILEKAADVIERVGYEQMKVTEIARNAAVSMSTIYTIFGSKEGLYTAYLRTQVATFMSLLESGDTGDPMLRLRHFVATKYTLATQKHKVLPPGARDNPLFFIILGNEFADDSQKVFTFLARCFRELEPALSEEKALQRAYVFNGHVLGYLQHWLQSGGKLLKHVDEVCSSFQCMLAHCVSSETGHSYAEASTHRFQQKIAIGISLSR